MAKPDFESRALSMNCQDLSHLSWVNDSRMTEIREPRVWLGPGLRRLALKLAAFYQPAVAVALGLIAWASRK
jgi:hypothetical protein